MGGVVLEGNISRDCSVRGEHIKGLRQSKGDVAKKHLFGKAKYAT